MTLRLLPDAERLVIAHLLTVDEVTDIVGQNIGSKKDKPYPRLVVARIGGSSGSIPAHLVPARVSVEAWTDVPPDGSKPQANLLIRTAEAALYEMVNAEHEDAVVTDVEGVLGPIWQPDPVTNRPRYILDVIVRAHPLPTS